ncbi:MAG: diaminopimelate epimerase [Bacteroidales bacterium]|nr:diaminopimelate epimerase [Bacteroidales bacterium]
MLIPFFKYEGAGNDFVIIDNRELNLCLDKRIVSFICDRHYGIGSDGLMILENVVKTAVNSNDIGPCERSVDFAMKFYNPDGSGGMMCGNGGRCIVRFVKDRGLIESDKTIFLAPDGLHEAEILKTGNISLKMKDVDLFETYADGRWLDTGTSHFVKKTENLISADVFAEGRKLRYDVRFQKHNGANINFYEETAPCFLFIRTYERGVENETLACGTGITAAALSYSVDKNLPDGSHIVSVKTKNDALQVSFNKTGNSFRNIYLTGPAKKVFEGKIGIDI